MSASDRVIAVAVLFIIFGLMELIDRASTRAAEHQLDMLKAGASACEAILSTK